MKSLVTGLAAAAVLTLAAVAPVAAQQNSRIIVVSHGQANDPFWSVVKNGVAAGGQDMKVQVDYRAETGAAVASVRAAAAANPVTNAFIGFLPNVSSFDHRSRRPDRDDQSGTSAACLGRQRENK